MSPSEACSTSIFFNSTPRQYAAAVGATLFALLIAAAMMPVAGGYTAYLVLPAAVAFSAVYLCTADSVRRSLRLLSRCLACATGSLTLPVPSASLTAHNQLASSRLWSCRESSWPLEKKPPQPESAEPISGKPGRAPRRAHR